MQLILPCMKCIYLTHNFAAFLLLHMVFCANSQNELVIGEVISSQTISAPVITFTNAETRNPPVQMPCYPSSDQEKTLTPNIMILEKVFTNPSEKSLISNEGKNRELTTETSECDKNLNKELICLFDGLSAELFKVTKFYYYFDVLSYIDKSIALIYEILSAPDINIDKNLMIFERKSSKVDFDIEPIKRLLPEVATPLEEKDYYENLPDLSCTNNENETVTIGTYALCLKKQYGHYDFGKIQKDYSLKNTMKCKELEKLQACLKNIKAKIFPMKEENIEKHADLFKEKFLKAVIDVYNSLANSLQKENENLDWIFEILNGISKGLGKCIEGLKIHETVNIEKEHSFQE